MNPGDKATIKGQLIGIGSMLGAVASQATSGASLPIMTPTGPAAAPGLLQMAAAINLQVQATQEIVKQLTKIVDSL